MLKVAIVGNGPDYLIPELALYKNNIDIWIGADRGALTLIKSQIEVDYAVGDFDSINEQEKEIIKQSSKSFVEYQSEKDETDIELALLQAFELKPNSICLFGVTGGRLDHELINIQLLYSIVKKNIQGIIVDKYNEIELKKPGNYKIKQSKKYPYISFIPYSQQVIGLTLKGFYYPLVNENISWGSTLCISNKLLSNNGTFSYEEGILLLIKSRDTNFSTIPL